MIPRGIIYHDLGFDIRYFLKTFGMGSNNESLTQKLQKEFAQYMGSSDCIAFPFARTAIYFALKSKGFEEGDEIIMPPISIKPMMDVVIAAGLKPVFVDLELETLCFDKDKLESAITSKTKAVLLTYLFGNVPNMEALMGICRKHHLFVIEDFSHALNATYDRKKLGTFGDVGIYSCSAIKTLDAFGGGLVVTDDNDLALALKDCQKDLKPTPPSNLRSKVIKNIIWNIATRKMVFALCINPLISFMKKLNPKMAKKMTGGRVDLKAETVLPAEWFETFTSVQAQAALEKINSVENEDSQRITNVEHLRNSVRWLEGNCSKQIDKAQSVYWQFVIYARDLEGFQKYLADHGIDSATTNLSLLSSLEIYPEAMTLCQNAEFIHKNGVFIPVYPRLTQPEVIHIADVLNEYSGM